MYEFDSIGTHWWIELLDGTSFDGVLIATLQRTAEQFDQRYSRFRDDSLVAELFRTRRLSHPPAEMIRMLHFAREMYDATDGTFDISVGNDLHRMGYGKREKARSLSHHLFFKKIVISPAEIILPEPVMLDFGGFGKGWLIDQFVRDLKLTGKKQFIVNGGGDLYVQADEPITFQLEDPYDETTSAGSIKIQRGALAGSSTVKRTWSDNGTQKHHIIDPITHDSSASSIVASFVAADSALIADTMATILILRPGLQDKLATEYNLQTFLIPAAH